MKLKDKDIIRICKSTITGKYFLVRGEYYDLIDKRERVIVVDFSPPYPEEEREKRMLCGFQDISYKDFKKKIKLEEEQKKRLQKLQKN